MKILQRKNTIIEEKFAYLYGNEIMNNINSATGCSCSCGESSGEDKEGSWIKDIIDTCVAIGGLVLQGLGCT